MLKSKMTSTGVALMLVSLLLLGGCKSIRVTPMSVRMAESEMKRSPEGWMLDFSDRLKWNYCHGLVSQSFLDVYDRYGDEKFFKYVKQYADTMIYENGEIIGYKPHEFNIDRINTGKILFRLYNKTKDEKYKKALDLQRSQLKEHPRTQEGGFWHKKVYPCQMWLDGLYMGAPFYAQYGKEFNEPEVFPDVVNQFMLIRKHLYDPATGLFRHAWDECRQQAWADSITGQSAHVWGRAMGWYAMALVDALDFIPAETPRRDSMVIIFRELVQAVEKVQDPATGLWYQVLDQGTREGNYLESSCSAMFTYAILKGVRMGYLDASHRQIALKSYDGIIKNFIRENADGTISITRGCAVAGLGGKPYRSGTFEYYISEPVRDDDPKAVGPFIMASLEMEDFKK
ncbi:unsaturated rhamnogalacturonyl hydrolase [Breznakibacter xylanolyticus]|uniref:Unsaturated rhamnogalacturonyl hydrolase n=1 Tax=Breznakibacter xylanolyticus TaxID=990 RepID=A0A2W7N148_9BACT|nr:glycoside hydrolase family 88 protein [Breznakibacter xylanolyticus]PZX13701.1 unsaturated rhamnogalacturonyl hydrolase [Breznakibacter xylanolyticus]